jgi:hypothetical protein
MKLCCHENILCATFMTPLTLNIIQWLQWILGWHSGITYEGVSKIFWTDAVKVINLTTKRVRKLPTSNQLHATWQHLSGIFGIHPHKKVPVNLHHDNQHKSQQLPTQLQNTHDKMSHCASDSSSDLNNMTSWYYIFFHMGTAKEPGRGLISQGLWEID